MIGFKTQDQRRASLSQMEAAPDQDALTPEQILHTHGMCRVMQAVNTYMGHGDEVIIGDKEHWLTHRLKAIKERYFAPL